MAHPLRYAFILVLVGVGTVLAAVGGWRYARESAPVSGPIVLVSVDTLRADHLPIYGYQAVRTPVIDALAADGIVFERVYSHAPQTLPAHVSLLSGRLPFDTGVRDDVGFTVPDGERMLAEMLRDRGYATGGVVSAYVLRKQTGIDRGFTFFDSDLPPPSPGVAAAPSERDGAESARIAVNWLTAAGTRRAFLFLHLYEPHKPYAPPPRFAKYAPYDGEIAYVDEVIGQLVAYLKANELYDQSTIILLADHGEGLGDHSEQEHGLFVYDEAVRVPLVIKQPAAEGAGRRVRDVVQHVDIVPTILDLANAPLPGNLRGRSLTPLLDGTTWPEQPAVYSESLFGRYHFAWSEVRSLTDGRYRYISAPQEELYDTEQDPSARENIAAARAELTAGFRAALDRLDGDAAIPIPSHMSEEERERFGAAGYGAWPIRAPADATSELPDPKEKAEILETYRAAVERAGALHWAEAIQLFQSVLRTERQNVGLWHQLAGVAADAGRYDQAVNAYRQVAALAPDETLGHLGAATVLLRARKLQEARDHAELAAAVAAGRDVRGGAAAHELLARIALAGRSAAAQAHAELARQADPSLPMPEFVAGRLLLDQGRYGDALPLLQEAAAILERSGRRPIADLHFYLADTLVRLERHAEAERHYLQELTEFPHNSRARAGLAMLYHALGRTADADQALVDLVRLTPTAEAYNLAARTWSTLGNARQAAAVRAQARALAHH